MNSKYDNYNNYYINNYNQSYSKFKNIGENNNIYEYLNKLEQRNKRLENINNIFLNMLREQRESNYNLMRNRSMENISAGSYPYLSYDKNGNKKLVYLDKESVNNNKIINGNYNKNYLVSLNPKNNSVADNNRAMYQLNKEKLKLFRNDLPYFNYGNNNYSLYNNIPQKVNSVQYINRQAIYKRFSSNEKDININRNNSENNNGEVIYKSNNNDEILNEINKMNINLNERLKRIENAQSSQKKDIDFLMGNTKRKTQSKIQNKTSEKSSQKTIKKASNKKIQSSNINGKNESKKESIKESNNKEVKNEEKKENNEASNNKDIKKEEKKASKKSENKDDEVVVEDSDNEEKNESKNKNKEDKEDNEEDEEDDEDNDDDDENSEEEENEKELAIKSFNSEEED